MYFVAFLHLCIAGTEQGEGQVRITSLLLILCTLLNVVW